MKKANSYIRIASILYLLWSLLIITFTQVFGAALLILGIILLANSFLSLEELKKNKVSLIIITIISFLLNVPAAILIILALDEINTVQLEKSNAPPTTENKKIDLLLKLGLAMILISGILFATTTWEIISNFVKVIALLGMGIVFLGLSKFSESKLKIESTTKAYYILGLSFFLLTFVGIGYFGVISPWFSYIGAGKNIVYCITITLVSIILYLINNKFKEKEYLYMGHISFIISIYYGLAAIGLNILEVTIILSIFSLIINIIPNNKLISTIKEISYSIAFLFNPIIFIQCFEANKYIVLIACIINIINTLLVGLTKKTRTDLVLSVISTYFLLTIATLKLGMSTTNNIIILFAVISFFSLLYKYQDITQDKWFISTNQIIYHAITTILVLLISSYSLPKTLIILIVYLIISIFNSLDIYKSKDQIDFRYLPIIIFIFCHCLTIFINNKLIFIGNLVCFSLSAFTYAAIYHLTQKQKTKNYYFIFLLINLSFTFLLNLVFSEMLVAITTLLLLIYIFFTRTKEEIAARIFFYITILFNIIFTFSTLTHYGASSVITNIIVLALFIFLTMLVKDSKLKIINYISIVVPLLSLINIVDINENLRIVITNIFWIYILFLIIKFIVKNKETKDIVATIGLSIIVSSIIFKANLFIGLYIGILSILVIYIAFNEEKYKKLFYCGVVITILNIIIQLWDFWELIPFWLYLLVAGIGIVIFVTYKELNKKEEPLKQQEMLQQEQLLPIIEESTPAKVKCYTENIEQPQELSQEKKEVDIENNYHQQKYQPNTMNFCPTCGTRNEGGKFCRICGRNLQI